MLYQDEWLMLHSHKICPQLLEQIGETSRPWKWMPKFLQKLIVTAKQYLRRHRVIIQLDEDHYAQVLQGNSNQALGCKIEEKLEVLNGFSTKINVRTIKRIVTKEAVSGLWLDKKVHALLDTAAPTVKAPRAWKCGLEGKGVGIAIVDTGVHPHPDLIYPRNRIKAFKDFVKNKTKPYDDNGHGTHCAGDAAGNGSQSKGRYAGPAPKANIIGVKVLDKKGSGYLSKVIAGIQWCIKNKDKFGIRVLSLSLGTPANQSYKDDPLCQAVRKAWDRGLVVCAAAGNEGPEPRTINSPGIEPAIITVGATDDKNTSKTIDDRISKFSSRGPTIDGLLKPDLVVPGANIKSLRSPGSYFDRYNSAARVGKYYTSMSGTSMATPICAGVVALILEGFPHLKPLNVKNLLKKHAEKISNDVNAQGAGLIDAISVIKELRQKG